MLRTTTYCLVSAARTRVPQVIAGFGQEIYVRVLHASGDRFHITEYIQQAIPVRISSISAARVEIGAEAAPL
jgi:hypothetical protein